MRIKYIFFGFLLLSLILVIINSSYAQANLIRPISMTFDLMKSLVREVLNFLSFLFFQSQVDVMFTLRFLLTLFIAIIIYFVARLFLTKYLAVVGAIVFSLIFFIIVPDVLITTISTMYASLFVYLFILAFLVITYLIAYKGITADTKAKRLLRIIIIGTMFFIYTGSLDLINTALNLPHATTITDLISSVFAIALLIEIITLVIGIIGTSGSWALEKLPEHIGSIGGNIKSWPSRVKRSFRKAFRRGERREEKALRDVEGAITPEINKIDPMISATEDLEKTAEGIEDVIVNQISPVISDPNQREEYRYERAFETTADMVLKFERQLTEIINQTRSIKKKESSKVWRKAKKFGKALLWEIAAIENAFEMIKDNFEKTRESWNNFHKKIEPKIDKIVEELKNRNLEDTYYNFINKLEKLGKELEEKEKRLYKMIEIHRNDLFREHDIVMHEDTKLFEKHELLINEVNNLFNETKGYIRKLSEKTDKGLEIVKKEYLDEKDYENLVSINNECGELCERIRKNLKKIINYQKEFKESAEKVLVTIQNLEKLTKRHREFVATERAYLDDIREEIKEFRKSGAHLKKFIDEITKRIKQKRKGEKELKVR